MDRENNNRGYEPGNIRFATRKENVANRRELATLERRIRELEAEVARLRSGERGAEE
jgi:polyhydroxyalkanoate synthesis regulator phasin